ncbi:protocadherin-11 X-linked [Elysia marginata]|uniref:Protocadherin-11 X-linked n=1 Tax=Elysia marginata TaxID=1093978 RepID=A0AAV4IAQ6_9GAST|nr:protocadherin-11 X-linked [Elysia marginata]
MTNPQSKRIVLTPLLVTSVPLNKLFSHLKSLPPSSSQVNLVIRQALDREARPVHVLTLVARDGGKPPLTGTVNIRVTVEDVNDNAPAFGQPAYNVSLPETAQTGTSVVRVTATDDDTDKYGVKEFRFDPQDADDVARFFAIDPATGMVTVAGSLLERQGKTLRLLVECLDKGLPPLVSRAEIDVTVKDTVNSAPIISNNVMFGGAVSEKAQSGTVVAVFEVEDRDAGRNGIVSCSIVSDAFELQPLAVDEYKVIVVRRLDRESEPVHNVKDENDEAPQFSQLLYEKTLTENTRPNQVLLRVTASDLDVGENARISYALVDADPILRVDTRGNIMATRPLDYEDHRQLKFKVMATDHGTTPKSNTADVIITIEDLNDEVPTFQKHRYEFYVKENEKANTVVNVNPLVATDRDSGENGRISYRLLPTVSPFRIRPDGVIVSRESLNREQRPQYTLTVEAVDAGSPQQTGSATVVIRVVDQNDHAPRIIYPKNGNSTVALAFDARPRSVVLSVLAEDEDEGLNKELDFHLASGSGRGIFDLNSSSGELVLSRALGVKDIGPHRLTIVVKDKSPMFPLASNSTFEVVVYAPNASGPAEQDRDREREHVLVVIILGVVTGAVTVAVIITIAVIRRTDSQRRKYMEGRAKMAPEVERLESSKHSVGYVISNSAQDGNSMRAPGNKDGSDGHGGDFSKDMTHDEGFADKSPPVDQGLLGYSIPNRYGISTQTGKSC